MTKDNHVSQVEGVPWILCERVRKWDYCDVRCRYVYFGNDRESHKAFILWEILASFQYFEKWTVFDTRLLPHRVFVTLFLYIAVFYPSWCSTGMHVFQRELDCFLVSLCKLSVCSDGPSVVMVYLSWWSVLMVCLWWFVCLDGPSASSGHEAEETAAWQVCLMSASPLTALTNRLHWQQTRVGCSLSDRCQTIVSRTDRETAVETA